MRRVLLTAVLAAATLTGPAKAQNQAPPTATSPDHAGAERATIMVEPVGMLIATFDADGDGRTSRAELSRGVERSFRLIDAKGTGRMGYVQYADWCQQFLGNATALPSPFTVDTNADNAITLDELQAAIAHIFDRLDADHDGQVTRAELLTIRAAPAPDGGRQGGRGRHGGRGRGE